MVGGGLCCLFSFFTCSSVLLLGVCFYGVEASSCETVVHKKVGDTVELPACVETEGLISAEWKYGKKRIAASDDSAPKKHQFVGRLELNPTNFSLTVRELTVEDSGEFKLITEVRGGQGKTSIISLHVHEPIAEKPRVHFNFTWHPSNESCTVFLECSSASGGPVNYSWTVQDQTRDGSRLQHIIKNGNTDFTCTVRNNVDVKSAAVTVKCSNETQEPTSPVNFVMLVGAAGGGCLFIVILVGIVVGVCACKRREAAGSDSNDLTLYADITEVGIDEPRRKPSTVYETIDHRTNNSSPGTVYDKIQLSRMRNPTVEPFHVL